MQTHRNFMARSFINYIQFIHILSLSFLFKKYSIGQFRSWINNAPYTHLCNAKCPALTYISWMGKKFGNFWWSNGKIGIFSSDTLNNRKKQNVFIWMTPLTFEYFLVLLLFCVGVVPKSNLKHTKTCRAIHNNMKFNS